jgi:hypothetical protein
MSYSRKRLETSDQDGLGQSGIEHRLWRGADGNLARRQDHAHG